MIDAYATFRKAFYRWVREFVRATGLQGTPEELASALDARIPLEMQRQIGAALINKWLVPDPRPNMKHRVIDQASDGRATSIYPLNNDGKGKVVPCWESYIQLADYSRICAVAVPRGLTVRLEDRRRDITVWAGKRLLLYVENKTTRKGAESLLVKMQDYGAAGFAMNDDDFQNDALRKCKYLFADDAKPEYFALSSVGYEQLFNVAYGNDKNRFDLIKDSQSILAPLANASVVGQPPSRSPYDQFLQELDRIVGESIWLSPGTGQTAFNIYVPTDSGDAISLGVYKSGEMWVDVKQLGAARAEKLRSALANTGVSLDTSKDWNRLTIGGKKVHLDEVDPIALAATISEAIDSSKFGSRRVRSAQ